MDWPFPTIISTLHDFLGFIGYYRKFVRNYRVMAQPLTNLLGKGQLGQRNEAKATFLSLEHAMTGTPTLAIPNFNKPFIVETDAFRGMIGAVLA